MSTGTRSQSDESFFKPPDGSPSLQSTTPLAAPSPREMPPPMGLCLELLSPEAIERRLHALNLLITGLEGQYIRLQREYLSLHSDIGFPESCDDDLELCESEFGSRCGFFRTVPGLGNVVEANRLREDARKVMNLMVLHRYLEADDILSLIEAKLPEYRSFLARLRAAVTRLSRALRAQWNTIQLRGLRETTSDFENRFEVLHSRYAALPSTAFDDTLPDTPCQTLELDEEFGEGHLERGDLMIHLASLRNMASRLGTAIDSRRHPGEWAEELFHEGLMTIDKAGRRLGELEETVTAYDEAFPRPHLPSDSGEASEKMILRRTPSRASSARERPEGATPLNPATLKVTTALVESKAARRGQRIELRESPQTEKALQPHRSSILERYASLPTEEKETDDQAALDSPEWSMQHREGPVETGDIDCDDSRFSWYSAFDDLSDSETSGASDVRNPVFELRKAESDIQGGKGL